MIHGNRENAIGIHHNRTN